VAVAAKVTRVFSSAVRLVITPSNGGVLVTPAASTVMPETSTAVISLKAPGKVRTSTPAGLTRATSTTSPTTMSPLVSMPMPNIGLAMARTVVMLVPEIRCSSLLSLAAT